MRNARFSITISQSSSFPRSFPAQGQTAIPVLSWSGYPDILLLGSGHLISVSVVDRIHQFRENVFFSHRFQHTLIYIISQLLCGCRRVQLEKGSEKFVDFLRGDGIHRTVTLYRFWGVAGFYRNAGDGWVLDNRQVSRAVHIDRHLIGGTDGFTGFSSVIRCSTV